MNLLAIDTSTEIASVALLAGDELTCDEQGNQRTHAQFLLPMIDKIMVQSGIGLHQLDAVVFGCGPGSFTGLRIACSIAKGIAFAHDLGMIPVSSLASIAHAARRLPEYANLPVLSILDARMNELYWSYFKADESASTEQVSPVQDIVIPVSEPFVIAGVGLENYGGHFSETIKAQMSGSVEIYPNAAAMISLVQSTEIQVIKAADAEPVYVRNQVTQGGSRG